MNPNLGISEQAFENAARFTNFCQKMKLLLWERSKTQEYFGEPPKTFLPPEIVLDEIALDLWKYLGN